MIEGYFNAGKMGLNKTWLPIQSKGGEKKLKSVLPEDRERELLSPLLPNR